MPRYRIELGEHATQWHALEVEASGAKAAELLARNDLREHAELTPLVVTELDVDEDDAPE